MFTTIRHKLFRLALTASVIFVLTGSPFVPNTFADATCPPCEVLRVY